MLWLAVVVAELVVCHLRFFDVFARPYMQSSGFTGRSRLSCHFCLCLGFSPEGQWQSIIFSEDVKKMWWPVKTDTSTNPFSALHQELCPFKLKLIFSNITFWSAYLLSSLQPLWLMTQIHIVHYTPWQLVYIVAPISPDFIWPKPEAICRNL